MKQKRYKFLRNAAIIITAISIDIIIDSTLGTLALCNLLHKRFNNMATNTENASNYNYCNKHRYNN